MVEVEQAGELDFHRVDECSGGELAIGQREIGIASIDRLVIRQNRWRYSIVQTHPAVLAAPDPIIG